MKRTARYSVESGGLNASLLVGGEGAELTFVRAGFGHPMMHEVPELRVTVDLALVVELMREAGYRVEEPKR